MLLLCVCHLCCLVMLTFRTEVICRYDDYDDDTFGHAFGSCWCDFVSFVNDFE